MDKAPQAGDEGKGSITDWVCTIMRVRRGIRVYLCNLENFVDTISIFPMIVQSAHKVLQAHRR
jgi:hypothetical protein